MDPRRHFKPEGVSMLPASYASPSSSARSRSYANPNPNPSIDVPSFSAFQAQTSRVNVPSPVRRKPLPPSASPILNKVPVPVQLSSGGRVVAVGEEHYTNEPPKSSIQEPTLVHRELPVPTPVPASPPLVVRDLDQFPRGHSPLVTPNPQTGGFPVTKIHYQPQHDWNINSTPTRPHHVRLTSEPITHEASKPQTATNSDRLHRAATMSLHPGGRPNALRINADSRSHSDQEGQDPKMTTKQPRSPGPNKLTSFFGWSKSSPIAELSPSFSSVQSHSPNQSPIPSPHSLSSYNRSPPKSIDVPKANAEINASYFSDTGFLMPPHAGSASAQLADMEEELREVSSELAGSIRRELELEDLVDRLQLEAQQGPELSRRTSDYYSDSGTSSFRYPQSEVSGIKTEDLAKMKRLSEQEKAQFKLNMSQKLQVERDRRKVLELHVQQLGDQMQQMDEDRARSSNGPSRVKELENSLEDMKRRLLEERRGKDNFEDLLNALRGEIQQHRDERDNLRDEVIPQLRARLDGLEGESSEYQNLTYENARLQQEMQSLKNENTTLMNARRLQLEMQQHTSRFTPIAEEGEAPQLTPGNTKGLVRSRSRSNSASARGNPKGSSSRPNSLTRSSTVAVSAKDRESRDSLADRVKDIELQRDALHSALRNLLDRHKYETREHNKKVRALEIERDRALRTQSPRRMGYERKVLRDEITQLRRRADEALVQKWQCEKGLGGLKMDLDRAEQETSSLRILLQEHDILVPEISIRFSQDINNGAHATSASLEKAYKDLRETQVLSIMKLRELSGEVPSTADDTDTSKTMELLLKSMSDAETERDSAQKEAGMYRAEAESLQEAGSFHTTEKAGLVEQLRASASRVEALALQVRTQLEANRLLRERLAEAVGRGESEQKKSASRINSLQGKLKTLEDMLMTAQQHSEDAFAQHEEEVREMQESHNVQLQRLKGGLRTPTIFTPKSPLSPMFTPRLDKTTSGMGMSMTEAVRTEVLQRKVVELEGALGDADREMEEVVSRMNMAQIEVMELQSERDEAMRQTRKLQAAINGERANVNSLLK